VGNFKWPGGIFLPRVGNISVCPYIQENSESVKNTLHNSRIFSFESLVSTLCSLKEARPKNVHN
jgi:hypothetical protein